eukprot:symbB.v1.2.017421.t1/scaffold1359.1/size123592/6
MEPASEAAEPGVDELEPALDEQKQEPELSVKRLEEQIQEITSKGKESLEQATAEHERERQALPYQFVQSVVCPFTPSWFGSPNSSPL